MTNVPRNRRGTAGHFTAWMFPAVATLSPSKTMPSATEARTLIQHCHRSLLSQFQHIDSLSHGHLRKILSAMQKEKLAANHFISQDGYGHSDYGRDVLDSIFANTFAAEAACVRIQFQSGTHAIACVLFGCLRPGDEMISVAGNVYDTLEEVIGIREEEAGSGSLKDFGIGYRSLDLYADGTVNFDAIPGFINKNTKVVFVQRSFGYAWRKSLTIADIRRVVDIVKSVRKDIVVFVDNCYGEFVEALEPVHPSVGADIMAGSLIKNLGGTIVPSGAYLAGRADLVQKSRNRLSAPGVGGGATLNHTKTIAQGLYLSPTTISDSLKSSLLIGEIMHNLGYAVNPPPGETGFVRAIKLESVERLVAFCECVQKNGAVGSFFQPTRGRTEGYGCDVVFAQANFVDGSTSEMSADGAVRKPYVVFAQGGGLGHWQIVMEDVIMRLGYKNGDSSADLNST